MNEGLFQFTIIYSVYIARQNKNGISHLFCPHICPHIFVHIYDNNHMFQTAFIKVVLKLSVTIALFFFFLRSSVSGDPGSL